MRNVSNKRGVVTIALGKPRFIEMAKWLGMSLRLNAPDLPAAVLTDSSDPELSTLFTHVVPYRPEMGKYMEPKFHLDRFSPFDESFYTDSDCLVLNDLGAFFDVFKGHYFGIPGWRYLSRDDSDAAVDVPFVLDHFGIEALPKFNGGCYYFRRCAEATAFFDTARKLLADAETLRIGFYPGGGFSDEPLFALALALHGLRLTPTGTRGAWTPLNSRGPIHLDVLAGTCHFWKEGVVVHPDIVHFPAGYRECYAYPREVWKLKRQFGSTVPPFAERANTFVKSMAWRMMLEAKNQAKRVLRPSERRLSGKLAQTLNPSPQK
jgi:hypothetical protein